MILEKSVSKNIELSVIGCDPLVSLDSKVYLVAFVRFSNNVIYKPIKFFMKKRTMAIHSFSRKDYNKDQLFILTFDSCRSVLEALSQKGWIDMCRRFSLLKVHIAGLMRSVEGTHYAPPKSSLKLALYSFNGDYETEMRDVAAKYDVFVSLSAKKVALLGYRLFSERWRSILFPQSGVIIFSSFDAMSLQKLCQSPDFHALQSKMEMEEIGRFQS
ncbi:hypothetical protein [Reichenbachiella versicolor]|uniref:hypothetical protein n=1 Tax=Reichenbachiella versicolor TaxID=1821036 RepID=UPI000D6E5A5A|nr:hypothetical protein [Reichenbachiella versicolor]